MAGSRIIVLILVLVRGSVLKCRLSKAAMSNPRAACGPVEGFVRPSLGFRCSKISHALTTCPHNYLEFTIFYASGLQWHFITSGTIAVRVRTLSAY